MLRDIRLRFWPTYHDCLRWSQGGEVAILANEYVYILVMYILILIKQLLTGQ